MISECTRARACVCVCVLLGVGFDKTTVLTLCFRTNRPQNAASDQGLYCLSIIQQFNTLIGSKMCVEEQFKVKSKGVNS